MVCLSQNLEAAVADSSNHEARIRMAEASVTAGLAFSQTGTTGSHACSYVLTAVYGIPHGEACAFTLDSWFCINAKARPELERLSNMMGFAGTKAVADRINVLKKQFNFRTTLAEIGILDQNLDSVDSSFASGNMKNNIAEVSRTIVSDVFAKRR